MNRRLSTSSRSSISDGSASSRVSFSDEVSTKSVEPFEKDCAWYSLHELADFRRDAKSVLSAMRTKTVTPDTCTHGLEIRLNKKLAKIQKEIAISAVLEEQDYQIEEYRNIDHELLAHIYFQATSGNQLSATRRGRKHAKEVQDMWTC